MRYDFAHFPEDLVFQETGDRTNFQGRYVLRHPYNGDEKCDAMAAYKKGVRDRQEREAQTLSNLTGWDIQKIRDKMNLGKQGSGDSSKWWKKIWD
ncbi:MAG: hypothetical protein K8R21_05055 [Leptospira sp.]|nr:hypothetical protein [Leptospira sp.]